MTHHAHVHTCVGAPRTHSITGNIGPLLQSYLPLPIPNSAWPAATAISSVPCRPAWFMMTCNTPPWYAYGHVQLPTSLAVNPAQFRIHTCPHSVPTDHLGLHLASRPHTQHTHNTRTTHTLGTEEHACMEANQTPCARPSRPAAVPPLPAAHQLICPHLNPPTPAASRSDLRCVIYDI